MRIAKRLAELSYEVDVLHHYIYPLPDDGRSCIAWQSNGTLTYFDSSGYPAIYWDSECIDTPGNDREHFTSLAALMALMRYFEYVPGCDYLMYLLDSPVWVSHEMEYLTYAN